MSIVQVCVIVSFVCLCFNCVCWICPWRLKFYHILLHFVWGVAEAKWILATAVCVSVWLSHAAFPHYCTDPNVTWGNGRGCSLVVQCWADLQSVHGFRWQYSAEGDMSASACTSSMPRLSIVMVHISYLHWTCALSDFLSTGSSLPGATWSFSGAEAALLATDELIELSWLHSRSTTDCSTLPLSFSAYMLQNTPVKSSSPFSQNSDSQHARWKTHQSNHRLRFHGTQLLSMHAEKHTSQTIVSVFHGHFGVKLG